MAKTKGRYNKLLDAANQPAYLAGFNYGKGRNSATDLEEGPRFRTKDDEAAYVKQAKEGILDSIAEGDIARKMGEVDYKESSKKEKPSYKKGGSVKSGASKRADGCAQRGKTKGRLV